MMPMTPTPPHDLSPIAAPNRARFHQGLQRTRLQALAVFIKNAITARPTLWMLFLIRNKPQACEFVGIAEIAIHSFQTAKAGVSHPGPRVSSTLKHHRARFASISDRTSRRAIAPSCRRQPLAQDGAQTVQIRQPKPKADPGDVDQNGARLLSSSAFRQHQESTPLSIVVLRPPFARPPSTSVNALGDPYVPGKGGVCRLRTVSLLPTGPHGQWGCGPRDERVACRACAGAMIRVSHLCRLVWIVDVA